MGRRARWAKAAALVVLVGGGWALIQVCGAPDATQLRAMTAAAGVWAPMAFLGIYAALTLTPAPKNVMTALAAALFGFGWGAALSWTAAMLGAMAAFGLARVLGRDAVDRLLRGRLAQVDALLHDHGLGTILVVRLIPILPYTAINYGSGVSGVRFGPYILGSAVGMIPGTLAYAALGGLGGLGVGVADPWLVTLAVGLLVVLSLGGGLLARRYLTAHRGHGPTPTKEPDDV